MLLLGDASVDPRNYLGLGSFNFVPTRLVPTFYFNAPSDDWFTDFNSDTIPDLAIGRIPVKTAADANTVINKIATRTTPLTTSSQNAVLIADVPETFDFETEAAVAKTLLPPSFNVQRSTSGPRRPRTTTSSVHSTQGRCWSITWATARWRSGASISSTRTTLRRSPTARTNRS